MKQPSHERLYLPRLRTRADRSGVIDSSNPSAQTSRVTRTNPKSSSDHNMKAAGVSALITIEKTIVWALALLLAAFFLIVGASKLSDPSATAGGLSRWSNATLLYLMARAVEIAGAAMLLTPRWASVGAVGLAAMMAGSVFSHLTHNEPAEAIVPSVLLALLGIIAYARRPRQM